MASFTPVDHDPFAAPAAGSLTPVDHDPFATTAPQPSSDIAQPDSLPPLNPLTATTGDYLAKLHQFGSGVGQVGQFADDAVRRATNVAGIGDRLAAFMGGTNFADERAKTAAASERLGPAGSFAADMVGSAPLRAVALAPRALNAARLATGSRLAGWAAGTATSGAENAAISGASTLGQGGSIDDALRSAKVGALIGTVTGAFPISRETPQTPSTAALKAKADTAWQGPATMPASPSSVGAALKYVYDNLSFGERKLMNPSTNSLVTGTMDDLRKTNSLTADDIHKLQGAIMESANTDKQTRIAGLFNNALESTYGPAKPVVDAARQASSRYLTSGELDQWLANPQKAPAAIKGVLAGPDKGLYSHIQPALQPIADMANTPTGWGQFLQNLKSRAVNAGVKGAAGAVIGSPVAGALYGAAERPVASALKEAPITNSLLAAQHMNATGMQLPPIAFSNPSSPVFTVPSDILRQYVYSRSAAGKN